ncbi:hypothetical protein GCM10009634_32120 [Saccharothrix xinjiangensis]
MHTRRARAPGLAGADCRAAVREAEDLFAAATPGNEPAWIAYYDRAHLARDSGRALLHSALNGGEHEEARARLAESVARFPEGHSRGKALAKANLAVLTMARDDPHHAVALGHDALESLGGVRSDRVDAAPRQLATAGRRHGRLADVRELNRRVARVVGTGK